MCRNIRVLHNFDPIATDDEVRAAATQYVRKVSGMNAPSAANRDLFERAIDDVSLVTHRLVHELVTTSPPRDRAVEAHKARERWAARERRIRQP